jgi:hypothetical protein
LLLNFGFQGCVAGFRWSWLLLGLKVTRKDVVDQQNPKRDRTVESHFSQAKREMGHPAVPEPMSKKSMRVVSVFAFQVIDSPACCIGGHEDCRTRIGAHASVMAGTRHQVLSSRAKLPIAKRSATESKDPFSV